MLVYHIAFVALLLGVTGILAGLSVLNVRHGETALSGDDISDRIPVDDPEKTADYQRVKSGFGILRKLIGVGVLLLVLYSGVFAGAVTAVADLSLPPLVRGVLFLVGAAVVTTLYGLPFDAFDTFVVEEVFDFNEQSWQLWARDKVIGLLLQVVFIGILGAVMLALIGAFPTYWWVGAWVVVTLFSLVMMIVYPRVIAPLFNDFDPIEDGELRDAVDDVFEKAGFECEQMYTMDASKRSSKANAYFVGFGDAKRVVLFDTLVEQMEMDEIKGVIAHELAHWKHHHIWKRIGVSSLQMGIGLLAVHYLINSSWLYAMFGLPAGAEYAGLVLAGMWLQPLGILTSPLLNRLSISHEYEADQFAVEVMDDHEPMADALTRLTNENLSNPFPHPWYVTFHYDHPPVPDRIRHLEEAAQAE